MPRPLSLVVLVATAACASAPVPVAPSPALPVTALGVPLATTQAQSHGTVLLEGSGLAYRDGMPVAVPDTTKLEPMPVFRSDTTIDRAMVSRGFGRTFTLRGPANVTVNPSSDTLHLAAPRP
jgi:hypothetical protein